MQEHSLKSRQFKWLVAVLAVSSAVASALAFWQSTEFGDEANDLVETARYAQFEDDHWRSAFQAQLDFEFRVAQRCDRANTTARDKLTSHLVDFDSADLAVVIEEELNRVALQGLLIDLPCEPPNARNVAEAFEIQEFFRLRVSEPPELLRNAAERFNEAEAQSVQAAVWFAAALLSLAFAEHSTAEARRNGWVLVSIVFIAVGAAWVLSSFAAADRWPSLGWFVTVFGSLVVLLGLFLGLRFFLGDWGLGIPLPFWAGVLGAFAVLGIAFSAWGFTTSSTEERRAIRDADLLSSESRRALELGLQSTVALLETGLDQVGIEATFASDLQIGQVAGQVPDDIESRRDQETSSLDERWKNERDAWEQLARELANGNSRVVETDSIGSAERESETEQDLASTVWAAMTSSSPAALAVGSSDQRRDSCLDEESALSALPWHKTDGDSTNGPDLLIKTPSDLVREYREAGGVPQSLIVLASERSTSCIVHASVRSDEALAWGDRALQFAVAIVVLGLAGFILALAVDLQLPHDLRMWLLGSGLAGLIAGLVVAGLALTGGPTALSTEDIEAGSEALASSEAYRYLAECDRAREYAQDAVEFLEGNVRAHLNRAYVAACDSRNWLIDPRAGPGDEPRVSGESVFLSALEEARRLGATDSVSKGNLGWAHLLAALSGQSGDEWESLEKADALTAEALHENEDNLFFCFNSAFTALARGETEIAVERYERAIALLRDAQTSCHPDERETVAVSLPGRSDTDNEPMRSIRIQRWMKLLALADLELLPDQDSDEYDTIKEMILADAASEDEVGRTEEHPSEEWELDIYPQEIRLWHDGWEIPFSAVWYHRSWESGVWSVLVVPSFWTLIPGDHRALWDIGALLPDGEYRVDIHVDGRLVTRKEISSDFWSSRGLDSRDFRRVEIADIGVSLAVPDGRDSRWERRADEWSGEIRFDGPGGGVAIRRVDGSSGDELVETFDIWTDVILRGWDETPLGDDETGLNEDEYYLGLPTSLAATTREGLIRAAGHQPYPVVADGGIQVVDMTSCPGSSFMMLINAVDSQLAEMIWLSQTFTSTYLPLSTRFPEHAGTVELPQFSVDTPDGWRVRACPYHLVATHESGANFWVSTEKTSETLAEYVQRSLDELSAEFSGFTLESRSQLTLPNEVDAERIDFTWSPDDLEVRQTRVFAISEGRVFVLTFTTTLDSSQQFTDTLARVLESFAIGEPPPPLVEAVCASCTPEELQEHQSRVSELAGFFSAINESCVDTTDDTTGEAVVRVACELSGGFDVSYVQWSNGSALNAVADSLSTNEGATVLEWDLYGDFDDPDGLTIEWVEDGVARFFWTYDDLLRSGDASLAGGDQQRLNNWWNTTGALTRD